MSPAHRLEQMPATGSTTRGFPRRIDYIGGTVLVLAALIWALFRFGIAKSLLSSPQALLILAAAAAVGIGLAVVLWRTTRRPVLARAVGLLPLVGIFVFSEVVPILSGGTTSEDRDPLAAATASSPAPSSASTSATPLMSSSSTPSTDAPPPTTSTPVTPTSEQPTASTSAPASTTATTSTAAPTLLGEGTMAGIDHDASGIVRLIRTANGSYLVRLQSFSVEPGPAYRLFLVPGPDMQIPQRGIDLGPFATTKGSVNVAVPGKPPLQGPVTVLIWCDVYAVPIANATINV